jgi:CRP-like cAMP-binding protein
LYKQQHVQLLLQSVLPPTQATMCARQQSKLLRLPQQMVAQLLFTSGKRMELLLELIAKLISLIRRLKTVTVFIVY